MSRCIACNRIMSEQELTLRMPESGQFADLCGTCYRISFDLADDKEDDVDEMEFVTRLFLQQNGGTDESNW